MLPTEQEVTNTLPPARSTKFLAGLIIGSLATLVVLLITFSLGKIFFPPGGSLGQTPTPQTQNPPATPPVTPPVTTDNSSVPGPVPPPAGISLKLFVHKSPESNSDFAKTFLLTRNTNRTDVATFLMENYFSGLTAQEKSEGFYIQDPTKTKIGLTGVSNCGGKDFQLGIADGTATLQLCRRIDSASEVSDSVIAMLIGKTLQQFSTVQKVKILNPDGNCFADASGMNLCKAD